MGTYIEIGCLIFGTLKNIRAFFAEEAIVINSPIFREFRDDMQMCKLPCEFLTEDPQTVNATNEIKVPKPEFDKTYGVYFNRLVKEYEGFTEDMHSFLDAAARHKLHYEYLRIGVEEQAYDVECLFSRGVNYFLSISSPSIQTNFISISNKPLPF